MIDLQIEDHPSEGTWRGVWPLVLMQQLVASVMLDLLAVAGRELLKAHQHRRQECRGLVHDLGGRRLHGILRSLGRDAPVEDAVAVGVLVAIL